MLLLLLQLLLTGLLQLLLLLLPLLQLLLTSLLQLLLLLLPLHLLLLQLLLAHLLRCERSLYALLTTGLEALLAGTHAGLTAGLEALLAGTHIRKLLVGTNALLAAGSEAGRRRTLNRSALELVIDRAGTLLEILQVLLLQSGRQRSLTPDWRRRDRR